jgi:hypothetical protein
MINFIAFAALAVLPVSAQDFSTVDELRAALQARDAFSETGDCGIVDAKTLRPFEREEAVTALQPCFTALSKRYGASVRLAADQKGLALLLDSNVTMTSPLRRDLGRALERRENALLGHPVVLRRAGDEPARLSSLQRQYDECLKPMVLRRIDSSADFLKYYGACFSKDFQIQPSPAHKLGLMVQGAGTTDALNGVIRVLAQGGEVELMVMAYSETLDLP